METKVEPLAFGLKQIIITFSREESLGSVDELAEHVSMLGGVMSAEVVGVRRALG